MIKTILFSHKDDSISLRVSTFRWSDLSLTKIPRLRSPNEMLITQLKENNSRRFIEWVLTSMWFEASDSVKESISVTHRFNSQALFMNSWNVAELQKHLQYLDYIEWKPTVCDILADDEYGINLKQMRRLLDETR